MLGHPWDTCHGNDAQIGSTVVAHGEPTNATNTGRQYRGELAGCQRHSPASTVHNIQLEKCSPQLKVPVEATAASSHLEPKPAAAARRRGAARLLTPP